MLRQFALWLDFGLVVGCCVCFGFGCGLICLWVLLICVLVACLLVVVGCVVLPFGCVACRTDVVCCLLPNCCVVFISGSSVCLIVLL